MITLFSYVLRRGFVRVDAGCRVLVSCYSLSFTSGVVDPVTGRSRTSDSICSDIPENLHPMAGNGVSGDEKDWPGSPAAPTTATLTASRRDLLHKDSPTLLDFLRHNRAHTSNAPDQSHASEEEASSVPHPFVGAIDEEAIDVNASMISSNGATGRLDNALSVYLETYGCQMNVSDSQVCCCWMCGCKCQQSRSEDDREELKEVHQRVDLLRFFCVTYPPLGDRHKSICMRRL
jgi:hypothetical protein